MLAIHVGRLIDGTGAVPKKGVTIMIAGERIDRVRPTKEVHLTSADEAWDLSLYTALPGLIDAHVHVFGSGDPRDPDWLVRDATELPAAVALNCFVNAQRNLLAGFTAIRDLGCRQRSRALGAPPPE